MRGALAICAISAVLFPVVGYAQDLSDEELLNLFLAQRDAYLAAQSGDTEQTRGLTIITADDVTVSTEAPATAGLAVDTATESTAPAGEGTVVVATESPELTAPEAELVPVAATGPTQLVQVPEDLMIDIRIEFAFDSAALTDEQKPKLQQLCTVMKAADIQLFRIVGHTDNSGGADYNERLSLLRAEEVQRYFINDCGIAATRLQAVGLGERFLLDDIDPRSDENRRVEFQALS